MLYRKIIVLLVFLCAGQAFAGLTETRKVFARLVLAIGKNSVSRPVLIISNNTTPMVTMSTGEILMDQRLVRYCSRFGADSINALAYLLSHELVHYYHEHLWGHKFGTTYENSDWGKKVSANDTSAYVRELHETQADQLGFYYAFSAGYEAWRVAAPVLDSVYKWYKLEEKIDGYPTRTQRKEILALSAAKFTKLIPVFEMSNHLRVLSAAYRDDQQSALLDFAGYGYEYLYNQNVQSAEMYNNIAVSKILRAQKYVTSPYARLQLPLILDQSSMMYQVSRHRGADEEAQFNELMEDARDNLEKALKLDATYWPAAINKCIVLVGLQDFGGAEYVLNSPAIKSIPKKDKNAETALAEVRGLIYFYKGDSARSKESFRAAMKGGSFSAQKNQLILKGSKDTDDEEKSPAIKKDTLEKWGGKMVYPALDSYPTNYSSQVIYDKDRAHLFQDSTAGYKVFELKTNTERCAVKRVKIALNADPKSNTSRGIGMGNSGAELIVKYGDTNLKVLGTVYTYWIYPKQNMVMMVGNSSHLVEGWFYYFVK